MISGTAIAGCRMRDAKFQVPGSRFLRSQIGGRPVGGRLLRRAIAKGTEFFR